MNSFRIRRANHPDFNCYLEGYSSGASADQASDVIVTRVDLRPARRRCIFAV